MRPDRTPTPQARVRTTSPAASRLLYSSLPSAWKGPRPTSRPPTAACSRAPSAASPAPPTAFALALLRGARLPRAAACGARRGKRQAGSRPVWTGCTVSKSCVPRPRPVTQGRPRGDTKHEPGNAGHRAPPGMRGGADPAHGTSPYSHAAPLPSSTKREDVTGLIAARPAFCARAPVPGPQARPSDLRAHPRPRHGRRRARGRQLQRLQRRAQARPPAARSARPRAASGASGSASASAARASALAAYAGASGLNAMRAAPAASTASASSCASRGTSGRRHELGTQVEKTCSGPVSYDSSGLPQG